MLCEPAFLTVWENHIERDLATGWKARDFALTGTDGKTYSLGDVRGPKGTLVVFICNHCPYVKASINRIVVEANALRGIGIGTIAIMPNDTDAYPEDSFDNMKAFGARDLPPSQSYSRVDLTLRRE